MNKKYLILSLVVVLSLVLLIGCTSEGEEMPEKNNNESETPVEEPESKSEESSEDVEEEKVYAPDFSLTGMDGETYTLSDFQGKKVIVNFWATWCPYCVKEMPDLTKLSQDYSEDLVVLAINVDERESKIQGFLDDNPEVDLNILLDPKGKTAGTYGANALPLTIGINSDGSVETGYPGMLNYEQMVGMYEMLN
jgi:thiol-disulfide isomerase/thioredoxin